MLQLSTWVAGCNVAGCVAGYLGCNVAVLPVDLSLDIWVAMSQECLNLELHSCSGG